MGVLLARVLIELTVVAASAVGLVVLYRLGRFLVRVAPTHPWIAWLSTPDHKWRPVLALTPPILALVGVMVWAAFVVGSWSLLLLAPTALGVGLQGEAYELGVRRAAIEEGLLEPTWELEGLTLEEDA